jgi:ribosomal protein L16 Arg81 hydroxylase
MKPGDVMYIPIGVFHSAVANFPRASLILDYDVLNTQG